MATGTIVQFNIGSDNGLSPNRCQVIIETNAQIIIETNPESLFIGDPGISRNEIWSNWVIFSLKKMCLKMS